MFRITPLLNRTVYRRQDMQQLTMFSHADFDTTCGIAKEIVCCSCRKLYNDDPSLVSQNL